MAEEEFTLVAMKKRKSNHTPPKNPNSTKKTKRMISQTTTRNRFHNLSEEDSSDSSSEDEEDLMKRVMENVTDAEIERKQGIQQPCTSKDKHRQKNSPRNNSDNDQNENNKNNNRKQRIPPIVLHGGVSDPKKVKIFMNKITEGKKYVIKWGENRTTLYVYDIDSWTSVTDALKKASLEFHSFTCENEKTHSFVLSGLSEDTTVEEVLEELRTTEKIQVKNVFAMRNTWTTKFLVITDKSITLKMLENFRVILNTRIKWQRYYNNKKIIQCHRCQEWGHATSNCFAKPNCLKCAEAHFTTDCKLDRQNAAKCVNCEGAHPANSTDCPHYKEILSNYEKRKKQTQIQPARQPPPNIGSVNEFRPLPIRPSTKSWNNDTKINEKMTPFNENLKKDYDEMHEELLKLNQLINIKKFTENLKKLNARLSECKTESQKFMVMQHFHAEIDSNGC